MSSQAIPDLEASAANYNTRALPHLEADDLPPYPFSELGGPGEEGSVEDLEEPEEPDDSDILQQPQGFLTPEQVKRLYMRPFDDAEVHDIARAVSASLRPEAPYYVEAHSENHKIQKRHCSNEAPESRKGTAFCRKRGVMVRHNVKRRWEKLGVWNPEWGFAGRKTHPSDDFRRWRWRWQPKGAADDEDRARQDAIALAERAVRLRLMQERCDDDPVIPRSCPSRHTTTAEGESFLISRPWFVFRLEVAEEAARYRRLSPENRQRYPFSPLNEVIRWWKFRGDWRDEYENAPAPTSWKWRHESPSPEPEDLGLLDKIRCPPAETPDELRLTRSEIQELEAIHLTVSEQPGRSWAIEKGDEPPFFPGQIAANEAERQQRLAARFMRRKARMERRKQRANRSLPKPDRILSQRRRSREVNTDALSLGIVPLPEHETPNELRRRPPGQEQQGIISYSAQGQRYTRPRRESPGRGHWAENQIIPSIEVDTHDVGAELSKEYIEYSEVEEWNQHQDQPSSPLLPQDNHRVRGTKRRAESHSPRMTPSKRVKTGPGSAIPLNSHSSMQEDIHVEPEAGPSRTSAAAGEPEAQPKRGRGRPRKKKRGRVPASTQVGNSGKACGTDAPRVRRRGRPRKNE